MPKAYYVDLDTLIEAAIREFEEERETFWKQDPDNYFVDLADGIANLVLRASHELVEPERSSNAEILFQWPVAQVATKGDGPLLEAIRERLQIAAAWEFSTGTDRMAVRCTEIARQVVKNRPAEPVLRYLRRLSRCYIAGFLPECVILCRAVLENALVETFERKGVPIPATAEGKSSMASRLDSAVFLNWLSPQSRRDAWIVWKRGSKAAHEDPTVTQEVLETVLITLRLLRELHSA